MIFCIAMEMIVVLILVLVVGWNYGMGTQLVEWIEQMRKPVVKELDISGINSPYAVLMQVRGGRVIGEINGDQQMYPASMTKIMTTIVAIENLKDLDQEITLTNEMFEGLYEQDATQAGFQPGETVRAIDLLYGVMLPSGAECCIALADTISGSEADFVALMNEKAAKLGMSGTNFCDTTVVSSGFSYLMLCIIQCAVSAGLVTAICYLLPLDEVPVKAVVDTCLFFVNYKIQKNYIFKNKETL